jgi:acetate kinase
VFVSIFAYLPLALDLSKRRADPGRDAMTENTVGHVLTVNAGSSSVRLALATIGDRPIQVTARMRHDGNAARPEVVRQFVADHAPGDPAAIIHRVVHGGPQRGATSSFDETVESDVAAMVPVAPLHNPPTLAWLALCRSLWPAVPQLAVFDHGFFADLPAVAATYGLPASLSAPLGLRRLGFHGLAHRSLWQTFARRNPGGGARVVCFQLGSGCSAAALRDGRPIDTSMGFSPLEGLMMATRSGDLDPGILLYLQHSQGMTAGELASLLEQRSGLAGISGTSGDLRSLLASEAPASRLAVEVFCYRARKYLGAYMAALGGCDAVLLGGGIAENVPSIRAQMLAGLDDLGVVVDPERNARANADGRITADGSRTPVWVLPTDEEMVMAEEASTWLGRTS